MPINDKVSQQLIEATNELKQNMWQRIRGYNGVLKDEENVWVFWFAMHGVVDSAWELHIKALWELFVATAESIHGFEWMNEYISGDGGSDWFLINLTETTDEAWQQWLDKFERPFLREEFKEMIVETTLFQEMEQEREDKMLEQFWREWMPDELYLLPEKYYKGYVFPGMQWNDARFFWAIRDQKAFNTVVQKLFIKALNEGDVSLNDVGDLSITQCVHCKEWDLTNNTKDYGICEYAHPKCQKRFLKKTYPKKLL